MKKLIVLAFAIALLTSSAHGRWHFPWKRNSQVSVQAPGVAVQVQTEGRLMPQYQPMPVPKTPTQPSVVVVPTNGCNGSQGGCSGSNGGCSGSEGGRQGFFSRLRGR